METEAKQRVRPVITEMDFPHQGRILTATHPFYGPASSLNLLRQIRGNVANPTNYREPTAPEIVSFVHEYFNGNEPQARDVNQLMRSNYFRGFTGILYLPQERTAHFIDFPKFDADSIVVGDDLIRRLGESRAQVAFEHLTAKAVDWRNVAKDPYLVGFAGSEEGAEKLAEFISKHPKKEAYVWVPNISDLKEPIVRVAGLGLGYGSDRLIVFADVRDVNEGGFAFGVLRSAESKS